MTIVAGPKGGHQNQLLDAARRRGLDASIIDVNSNDISSGIIDEKLGRAVIWRSSSLDIKSERPAVEPFLKNRIVASNGVFKHPMLYHKFYQQQMLAADPATTKWSIPTYKFSTKADFKSAIADGTLKLPVIVKPNAGSRGEGIILVKSLSDIESIEHIRDYVFQSFIPNDGDWRIIVVGGSPIGVLLRQGDKKSGQFINNISQGASGSNETDPKTLYSVRKIATKIASLFHLEFCGVDIIRNCQTGEYSVLEVNTAPQWLGDDGFQSITGVDVAESVIDWIVDRGELKSSKLVDSVESYYKKRIEQVPSTAFHFASRLWLWTGDSWAREQLDAMQAEYIGTTPDEIMAHIDEIVESDKASEPTVNRHKPHRKSSFEKYDRLSFYNKLLFKVVFCDSLYDLDIRPYVRKYVSDKEFTDLFNRLIEDGDAMRMLSTFAINYLYLLKNYFKDKISKSSAVLVSTSEIMSLMDGYKAHERDGTLKKSTSSKLQVYLLTHAIIGESRFYARPVKGSSYKSFCEKIEQIITSNYYEISLDNKLEFLVCCKICGYESNIRKLIEQECQKSVSWAGNFLVDSLNTSSSSKTGNCLRISEHRNTLYLMSQKPFVRGVPKHIVAAKPKLPVIGRLARIRLPQNDVRRAIARVDSGATSSSIDATNVQIIDGKLHFTLFRPDSPVYTGVEYVADDYSSIKLRNSTSKQERYAVTLKIELDNREYDVLFNLSDRSHMTYPILLGRNFLRGRYTVDTAKQFIVRKTKKQ